MQANGALFELQTKIYFGRSLTAATSLGLLAMLYCVPAFAAEGTWAFEPVSLGQDANRHIVYSEGNKEVFSIGCSKFIGFTALYPGPVPKTRSGTITVRTGRTAITMKDALQIEDGTARITVLLDKTSVAPANRLFWMLESGLPLTVSAAGGRYTLPAPALADITSRFNQACTVNIQPNRSDSKRSAR
jgi:hypothetical protein